MGFVKRRASTKAKIAMRNFEHMKAQFLVDVKAVADLDEIPFDSTLSKTKLVSTITIADAVHVIACLTDYKRVECRPSSHGTGCWAK